MNLPTIPIPVFQQPAESFAKWQADGFNAVINPVWGPDQQCKTGAEVVAAAHARGLYTIGTFPECDAWNQVDEADGKDILPATLQTQYQAWKAADPNKLVFLNLDGRRRQFTPLATYMDYAKACDWIGMDRYPVSTGESGNISLIGGDIKTLIAAAPGKKIFYIFEASNQHIENSDWMKAQPAQAALCRPPSATEMKMETDIGKAWGLNGFGFFTHDSYGKIVNGVGGWASFDSTTPEIAAALPGIIAGLSPTPSPVPPVPVPAPSPVDAFAGMTVTTTITLPGGATHTFTLK